MKNEIIKYYIGDFLNPLGRPHLVLVGQEFEDKMICEKFILFEETNGKHTHIGEIVTSPIVPNLCDNLDHLMKSYGLEHAKSIIYLEAFKEIDEDRLIEMHSKIKEVTLQETTQSDFILYMKFKSIKQLNWIQKATKSNKLKEIIKLYKSFQITTKKIDTDE